MKGKDIFSLDKRVDRIALAIFIIWVVLQIFMQIYLAGHRLIDPSTGDIIPPTEWFYFPGSGRCHFASAYDYTEVIVYSVVLILLFIVYKLLKPVKR